MRASKGFAGLYFKTGSHLHFIFLTTLGAFNANLDNFGLAVVPVSGPEGEPIILN